MRPLEAEFKRGKQRVAAHFSHFQKAITTRELENLGFANAAQAIRVLHITAPGETIDVDAADLRHGGFDDDKRARRVVHHKGSRRRESIG